MSADLLRRLTRLSEAGDGAVLSGAEARRHRGAAFDRLLTRRALVERAPLTDWEVCGDCECGIDFRPIERVGGALRAVCPLDPSEDVILDEDDLRTFEIDADVLAGIVAEAAGFHGSPERVSERIWHIGALDDGRQVFLGFEAAPLSEEGAAAVLARERRGAPATLLGPALPPVIAGRLADAGIHVVAIGDVLEDADGGVGATVPPSALQPTWQEVLLVVRPVSGDIVWRGSRAALSRQNLKFALLLARAASSGKRFASFYDIEQEFGREPKDQARSLRNALMKAGVTADDADILAKSVRSLGYKVDLDPAQIRIED